MNPLRIDNTTTEISTKNVCIFQLCTLPLVTYPMFGESACHCDIIKVTSHERRCVLNHWQLNYLLNSYFGPTTKKAPKHPINVSSWREANLIKFLQYAKGFPATWDTFTAQNQWCRNVSCHDDVIKWKHFPRYWPFVRRIHRSRWILHTKASDAELWCFLWYEPE